MPYHHIKLNDGGEIPAIAYGSSQIPLESTPTQIQTALDVGFEHIDTAQMYGNETEVGQGLKESGLARKDFWVTTKWSFGKVSCLQSCKDSLSKLGLEYIDLYLIHNTRVCNGDIVGAWKQMEEVHKMGLVKHIGVSNFSAEEIEQILAVCTVKPVVNQIQLHPGVWHESKVLVEYGAKHHIVTEAYSPLLPLRQDPDGKLAKTVAHIGAKRGCNAEQVLLAWVKTKNAVAVTKSSKRERLVGMIDAGDIDLTAHEIDEIERVGKQSAVRAARMVKAKHAGRVAAVTALGLYALYKIVEYYA